jgi:putative ABC transport system substrate-binding protein
MTTRRHFLLAGALGALGLPYSVAQTRPARIGMLSAIAKSFFAPVVIQRLDELGYREGSTRALEFRSADGKSERFPRLANELLKLNCDLIFTIGPEHAARPFRDVPSTVPVVFLAIDYDPVEKGIVDTLARPGRNMTGVYALNKEIVVKRLELAKEVLPGAMRFLVFSDPYNGDQLAALRRAAESKRYQLAFVEFAQPPYSYAAAVETGRRAGADALILLTSPVFANNHAELFALAVSNRLPVIGFATPEAVFPVGYSANAVKIAERAAEMGVRILKGAKPAEMPIDQAGEFDLQVNLKAAKALGMKIPYSVLARATRLVE